VASSLAAVTPTCVIAQTQSDGQIVARSEAEGQAREVLGRDGERLGELSACWLILYIAGADRSDPSRFQRFGEAMSVLQEDLSNRVEAHAARFAVPIMRNMRIGAVRLAVWRHVARRMDKAENANPVAGSKPTTSQVSSCWLVSDKAIALVPVLGLDKSLVPARRRK